MCEQCVHGGGGGGGVRACVCVCDDVMRSSVHVVLCNVDQIRMCDDLDVQRSKGERNPIKIRAAFFASTVIALNCFKFESNLGSEGNRN